MNDRAHLHEKHISHITMIPKFKAILFNLAFSGLSTRLTYIGLEDNIDKLWPIRARSSALHQQQRKNCTYDE